MTMTTTTTNDLSDALRAMVTAILRDALPVVLAELAPHLAKPDDTIDAERFAALGLGTRRQFTDAARASAFPTFKGGASGRAAVAKLTDVRAWLETRTTRRTRRASAAANDSGSPETIGDVYAEIVRRAG